MQLYEKYRPKTLNDFIGQPKIKKQLGAMMRRDGWDRDAFWLQGPSGTGKTSLAWIVANTVANEFDIEELDGDKCHVQAVRELERSLNLSSMFGLWKVVIVNESHAMSLLSASIRETALHSSFVHPGMFPAWACSPGLLSVNNKPAANCGRFPAYG